MSDSDAGAMGCLLAILAIIGGAIYGAHSWWEEREEKGAVAAAYTEWRQYYCNLERIDGDKKCFRCKDENFLMKQIAVASQPSEKTRMARIETRLGGWKAIEHGVLVCE